ncbi:MAG: hypothetical protein V4773_16740 [Verrucomicrobiota bacterium]
MKLEYEKWAPIEDLPVRLLDAEIKHEADGICVLLMPFPEDEKRLLRVRFSHVLAHAWYDDFAFALGNIEYVGKPDTPTFIVRNYEWPGSHAFYEEAGPRNVRCYRFGTQNAIVDVVASGSVEAGWIENPEL